MSISNASNNPLKVIKRNYKTYPMAELWMEVFLVGPTQDLLGLPDMFARAKCKKAVSVETADLVVFAGGEDVNPQLYGADAHSKTFCNPERDAQEVDIFLQCVELGIPMTGICRGAQFGHVMNGGKLYQHVDKHTGDHRIWDHMKSYTIPKVSSVHHQSCIPNSPKMRLVASISLSQNRWVNNFINAGAATVVDGNEDVEAFWYEDTAFFGVQGHPEYQDYQEFTSWYTQKLSYFIHENKSISLKDGNFRKVAPGSVPEEVLRNLEKMREQTNVITLVAPNA